MARSTIRGVSTGDLGGNATFAAFRINEVDSAGWQVRYPAAWNGTFTPQVSEDSSNGTDGNWTDAAPDVAAPASAAGAGSFTIKISKLPFAGFCRLNFTRTSGSGVATVNHSAKGT